MKAKLFFLFTVFSISILKAQPYSGVTVGFGMPGTWTVLGVNSERNDPANTFSNENVIGSYGRGFNFGVYVGDWVNEHVGIELGINYLQGVKYTFTDNHVFSANVSDNYEDKVSAKSFRLAPGVRFGFGENNIRPYMRAGIALGIINKITDHTTETFVNPGGTDIGIQTFEYKKGLSVGFTSGVGVNFLINDNFMFFAELSDYFISWAPTKGELTEATVNGADQLGGMTTDQKEFEYVDKVDQTMNTSSGQPTSQLKTYFPMSSFGLNVGVHFAFGG